MATSTARAGARQARGSKQKQTAPLTRIVITDALRSWVIPTVAAVIGFLAFVAYNLEVVDGTSATTVIGTLALLIALFFGLRDFTMAAPSPLLAAILVGFAALWSGVSYYPFYRALHPGTPLFTADVKRDGPAVTVPLHGVPGQYNLLVEGHFLPVDGHQNRVGTYHLTIGHDGVAETVLEGTFQQEWRSERFGVGRRSSVVPVMSESTLGLHPIAAPEGHDLTLKLNDLSPGMRDAITVHLYSSGIPKSVLIALGVLTLVGALVVDAWRPKGSSEGLMVTLTAAVLLAIAVFRASSTAVPGFPQLMIAALVGAVGGALLGTLLARLVAPLKKRLPALA